MQKNDFLKTISSLLKVFGKSDAIKIEYALTNNNFFEFDQDLVEKNKIILPKTQNLKQSRSSLDMAACYLLFSDKKIHNKLKIDYNFSQQEKKIFDDFEKIRLISLVKNEYLGIAKNLLEKIEQDIDFAGLNNIFPLILLQEIFVDNFEIKRIKEFLNSKNIRAEIINKIKKMVKSLDNQELFAKDVYNFLQYLQDEGKRDKKENQEKSQKKQEKSGENENSQNQENIEEKLFEDINQEEKKEKNEEKIPEIRDEKTKRVQFRGGGIDDDWEEKIEFKKIYKVFTNKFDEIILPQKLVEKNELEVLRYSLELRIDKLEAISKRLTIKLKKKLLAKKNIVIEQSESEGILDRKKFTQIIANPFEGNFFVVQKQHQYQDTIVSILLDNSGSMRGSPIVMAAMACEIIAGILEKFAIKTEILGFTTADWKGGKSRKLWEIQDRQENPGRLNDLRHIIYKSANQSFKKAKVNLGLMLKEGMLKENIDGEALLWAKSRLMQREEKRKILMIISDGTPVDDSTNSTNDTEILVDHLHHAIKKIEKENKIEIVGIGIGHNVGAFYHNSISIKTAQELGDVMIEKIVDLI